MPGTLTIVPIAVLTDNYVWVIKNSNHQAIIVDPGEAKPVLTFLQQANLTLKGILITHHHWDHVGGITDIIQQYPVPVYGSLTEVIAHKTKGVQDGDDLELLMLACQVLAIPGHTLGHVAYYFPAMKAVFTGDTLFTAGCGRIFEGSPSAMYASLMKLYSLPNDTEIYCGHEYTLKNLQFAARVEPDNQAIQQRLAKVKKLRADYLPTVPALLSEEKKTNLFLRCTESPVIAAVTKYAGRPLSGTVEVFEYLRKWKNEF